MVTSIDVARIAGVSQATVSRVLNNPESVKPATREKVLRVMSELNYQPNLIARSLVTKHSKTIALVSPSFKNSFFVETISSMVHVAKSRDYKTTVFLEDESDWRHIIDTIRGNKVDGILLSSIKYDDPIYDELSSMNIPYMQLSRRHRNGGNFVVLDDKKAATLVTRHILDLGHKRIAYISGPTTVSSFLERKAGFDSALKQRGIYIPAEYVHMIDTTSEQIGKATWKLMHSSLPPTAIIGANDNIALTVLDAIMSMGLSVPDDVSLAGMDTIEISGHSAIQLTSVGHRKFRIGEIAIDRLIDLIEQKVEAPQQQILIPELIIRKTTSQMINKFV